MQKTFAIIGIAATVVVAFYLLIYTPISNYHELEDKADTLERELNETKLRVDSVYETFDCALNAHFNDSIVEAFYNDERFFTKTETSTKIKSNN